MSFMCTEKEQMSIMMFLQHSPVHMLLLGIYNIINMLQIPDETIWYSTANMPCNV